MLGLILYAAAGVALIGGLYGFDHWRQGVGVAKEASRVHPVMALCEAYPSKGLFGTHASSPAECAKSIRAELDLGRQAVAGNVSLQADLDRLDGQRKACSADVLRLKGAGDRAKAAVDARKPNDDRLLTLYSADRERLIAELQNVGKTARTCQQELAERNAAWQGTAKQRQRDFPAAISAPSGDVTIRAPK